MVATSPADPYLYYRRLTADGKNWRAVGRADIPAQTVVGIPGTGRLSRLWAESVFTPPPDPNPVINRNQLLGLEGTYRPVVGVTAGLIDTAQTSGDTASETTNIRDIGTAANPVIISDKYFKTRLDIAAQYVDFYNCDLAGPVTGLNRMLINATSTINQRIRFFDCRLWPQSPSWDSMGAKGHHLEFRRCEFRGCIDGFQHSNGSAAQGRYAGVDQGLYFGANVFHKFACFSPDPGAAGGLGDNVGHVDGIQLSGGDNIKVIGNDIQSFMDPDIGQGNLVAVRSSTGTTVTGYRYGNPTWPLLPGTSCMMLSPLLGQFRNLWIQKNWLNGGAYCINGGDSLSGPGMRVDDNVVGTGMRNGRNALVIAKDAWVWESFTGNTHEDDGTPANIRTRG